MVNRVRFGRIDTVEAIEPAPQPENLGRNHFGRLLGTGIADRRQEQVQGEEKNENAAQADIPQRDPGTGLQTEGAKPSFRADALESSLLCTWCVHEKGAHLAPHPNYLI